MPRFLRDNGLSITMFGLFLLFLGGQCVVGWHEHRDDQSRHGQSQDGFVEYLGSGHFWEATFENWESEFLQMAAYVFLTAFLYQRSSAESKDPDKSEPVDADPELSRNDPEAPWPVRRGGFRLLLYKNSLSFAFAALFVAAFIGHTLSGLVEHNDERLEHGRATVSLGEFLSSSAFWFQSLQNWQSEFLAVGSMVVLSIWLR